MGDLQNPTLIWLKGWLFLALGLVASAILLLRAPRWEIAALLAVAVWSFCRFYYFAFYVIEKYVDPEHRFTGLLAFFRYAFGGKPAPPSDPTNDRSET